ncbi:MAG: hypothetical protein IT368_06485 [Candidatus Hydrogenedentes bacterium]|nr:hypothetical protein [Candidatus Hydrogenedentota bacterium]
MRSAQGGPGPNRWSDSEESVWVDDLGLHLKIRKIDGAWHCAEVSNLAATRYGIHRFYISTPVDQLDPNVVASPFLYRDDSHEIDIEFSRWQKPDGMNAQYVVQPYHRRGNIQRFEMAPGQPDTTHILDWQPSAVRCMSYAGHAPQPPAGAWIQDWTCTSKDIPRALDGLQIHINLWLVNGQPPADGNEVEFIVKAIDIPAPNAPDSSMGSAPFDVDPSYLDRHDVVFQQPMQLEAEGFPLGNGDTGGLIWTHPNGVEIQMNKNDVWARPEAEARRSKRAAETTDANAPTMAVPRHCARVKVDLGIPVFSWIHHMNDFEGRFSLARGEARFQAHTAYSNASFCSWLAQDRNVWVIECNTAYDKAYLDQERSLASVSLERLGSRAFQGWYAGHFTQNPAAGIGQTGLSVSGGDLLLEEHADGMNFAVACRVLGAVADPLRRNNHRAELLVDASRFTVLVSVVTGAEAGEPGAAALALLDGAERQGILGMKAEKDAWFKAFWDRSFLKLGDDYLENIYYLRRYLMAIGSRGLYPVVFNGGLWRWNRDVVNWMTPHHWNMQQQYWGLCAANDCDLMRPYLDTYYGMIPGMARLATTLGELPPDADAILLAEMHNFDGVMVDPFRGDMRYNFTPAAQVASRFFEYYQYTGDRDFLAARAYPFMKKAANFYLHKLVWNPDTRRYNFTGTNYEDGSGRGPVLNPLSARNCIEALFKSCLAAAAVLGTDTALVERWQHVLDHLWDRRIVDEKDMQNPVIAASDEDGKCSAREWAVGGSIAFPEGIIGMDDAQSPLGIAAMNMVRSVDGSMYSHHPLPVIAARLGDGGEALRLITDGISEMQYFPQGLFFNCRGYPSDFYNLKLQANLIGGAGHPQVKWRDFFQCGMETISICATALQEMMLQSNEDKIRVFPAVPAPWRDAPLAFKLLARGGFLVAAQWEQGTTTEVGIKSRRGGECRLQNPWPGTPPSVTALASGEAIETRRDAGDVIIFVTQPGHEYLIRREGSAAAETKTRYASTPNAAPKILNERRSLGLGPGFYLEK